MKTYLKVPNEGDETARRLLVTVQEQSGEIERLLAEIKKLTKRVSEGDQIIRDFLAESKARDTIELILKLRPKAQRFLAARNAALKLKATQKATTDKRVWDALRKELDAGTPERAQAKRIAADLGFSEKHVRQTLRHFRGEEIKIAPKRR